MKQLRYTYMLVIFIKTLLEISVAKAHHGGAIFILFQQIW